MFRRKRIAALTQNFQIWNGFGARRAASRLSEREDYDVLVNALVGFVGKKPTLKRLKRARHRAGNKETLVVAGALSMQPAVSIR
ncbi:MAG: hypothetical protein ACLSA6_07910 [Holdemania massiliensis]